MTLSIGLTFIGKVKMRVQAYTQEGFSRVKLLMLFSIDTYFYIVQSILLFSKGISEERKNFIYIHIYVAYSILIRHTLNGAFC